MKTLLLIDANSIIHRCFHAMPKLTATNGRPIQAIYGLTNILLKIVREENPEYAAALFDRPEPTFREKEFPEYYKKLNSIYQTYRDTYSKTITKEVCEEIREDAKFFIKKTSE